MKIKTITYQRVVNLGNYESNRLELSAEILELEDEEETISRLMEMVERKVREDASTKIKEEIRQLRKELRRIEDECSEATYSLVELRRQQESDADNIPFDSGDAPNADGVTDGF